MNTASSCLYALGMLTFTIVFLIDWLKSRQAIMRYRHAGITAGLVVLAFNLLIIVSSPSGMTVISVLTALAASAVVFVRTVGFTMLGMHYCSEMGNLSFAFLFEESQQARAPSTPFWRSLSAQRAVTGASSEPSALVLGPIRAELTRIAPSRPTALRPRRMKEAFSVTFLIAAVSFVYTILLFLIASPRIPALTKDLLGVRHIELRHVMNIQTVVVVLAYAVAEDLFFRLGIQNFLAKQWGLQKKHYWLAIAMTTFLWTLGHAGALEPGWVKLAQTFPVGLGLGWLSRRYGVESSILAHGLLNVLLLFPSAFLIG